LPLRREGERPQEPRLANAEILSSRSIRVLGHPVPQVPKDPNVSNVGLQTSVEASAGIQADVVDR